MHSTRARTLCTFLSIRRIQFVFHLCVFRCTLMSLERWQKSRFSFCQDEMRTLLLCRLIAERRIHGVVFGLVFIFSFLNSFIFLWLSRHHVSVIILIESMNSFIIIVISHTHFKRCARLAFLIINAARWVCLSPFWLRFILIISMAIYRALFILCSAMCHASKPHRKQNYSVQNERSISILRGHCLWRIIVSFAFCISFAPFVLLSQLFWVYVL